MKLKLIETGEPIKSGDLIKFPSGRLAIASQDGIDNKGYVYGTKVVKPDYAPESEEVNTLSERFSYQDIVDMANEDS
jgi:hypothetical protein